VVEKFVKERVFKKILQKTMMMTIKTEINGIVILTIAMALDKVVYAVIKIVKNVLIVVEWFVNNHHNKNRKNNNHNSKTHNRKTDNNNSKNDNDNNKKDEEDSSKNDNDNSKNDDNNSKNDDDNSKNDNNSSNNDDNSNKENNSKNDNDNSKKDNDNSKKDNDNSNKDNDNSNNDDNNNDSNHKPSNKTFQTIVMVMAIIVIGINAMVYNKEENGVIKIEITAKDVVEHSVQCPNFLIKEIHHLGIVIGLVVME